MNETWLSRTEMMLGEDALTKLKNLKLLFSVVVVLVRIL